MLDAVIALAELVVAQTATADGIVIGGSSLGGGAAAILVDRIIKYVRGSAADRKNEQHEEVLKGIAKHIETSNEIQRTYADAMARLLSGQEKLTEALAALKSTVALIDQTATNVWDKVKDA
jgi:esterase/lipase